MEKILVINSGSSTIKADVFLIEEDKPVFTANGLVDKLGSADSKLTVKNAQAKLAEIALPNATIPEALDRLFEELTHHRLCKKDEVVAIGHRVVHGGKYTDSVLIDENVIASIKAMVRYAPLHNPTNLAGIEHCKKIFSAVSGRAIPQVAVFDTAFHQTMNPVAYTYAIPHEFVEKHGIRRYGFHGVSHEYVSQECARRMGVPFEAFNAIVLHLGNGASACAIRRGKSVDTSMGLSTVEGLVMGTRSGDLDPMLPYFVQDMAKLSAEETEVLLHKKSGLLGLCGVSDMREVLNRADAGDSHASLARDIFCLRVKKYIGSYLTWGAPHAIIFTGGIGENASVIRRNILSDLSHLKIILNEEKNSALPPDGLISEKESLAVYVIPTDEEWMIANEALSLVG